MPKEIFQRTELLVGSDAMQLLSSLRVIIFGLGGVGSWCAEGLVRSGIGSLTMVDPDVVCTTNINRQLPALCSTVGIPKVDVLSDRLTDINPDLEVRPVRLAYSADTESLFDLSRYDVIIDAIDSLADKALLILNATASGSRFYSSMGAALKMNPSKIDVAEFWKVKGCPLAASLRHKFRKTGRFPSRKFKCVYADEIIKNKSVCDSHDGSMTFNKVAINGTFPTTVAIFGLTLANAVLVDAIQHMES